MNLLEHYIEEVHSVEPYTLVRDPDTEFVKIDMTINVYGRQERMETVFAKNVWEESKEKGYFLA